MKPHLAPRKGRWYVWKSREEREGRPLGLAGRRTVCEALKAYFATQPA